MALEAAKAQAQRFIEVVTNVNGGTTLYNQNLAELRTCLDLLPSEWSAARKHIDDLLSAMDIKMVSKTLGTWRPFVVCVLRALKATDTELGAALKVARLTPDADALRQAEEAGKESAEGNLDKCRLKISLAPKAKVKMEVKKEDSEENLSPIAENASDKKREAGAVLLPRKKLKTESIPTPGKTVDVQIEENMQTATEMTSASAGPEPVAQKTGIERFMVTRDAKSADQKLQLALPSSSSSSSSSAGGKSIEAPPLEGQPRVSETKAQPLHRASASSSCDKTTNAPHEEERPRNKGGRPRKNPLPDPEQVRRTPGRAKKAPAPEPEQSAHAEAQSTDTSMKPPGHAQAKGSTDAKGYYACLCLSSDASAEQIRAAYKKIVLQHHPDKGGEASAFRATVDAYNFLSNPEKRAEYDGKTFTSPSCPSAAPKAKKAKKDTSDKTQVARDIYARMQVIPQGDWSRLLQQVDSSVIELLAGELEEAQCTKKPKQTKSRRAPCEESSLIAPEELHGKDSDYCAPGFKRKKDGSWWVQVAWRNFKVTTAEPIVSMERAVNLHCALLHARNSAMARYNATLSEIKDLNRSKNASASALDNCLVLTDAELGTLLQEEPYTLLSFSSDITTPAPRIETSWASFEKAMHFRLLVRLVQGGPLDDVKKLQDRMSVEAKAEKIQRMAARVQAAKLLKEVLAERKEQGRLGPSCRAPELIAPEQPLALTESTNEDLQKMRAEQEEMKARVCALEDSREKSEAAWRSRLEQQTAEHQKEMKDREREWDMRRKEEECEQKCKRRELELELKEKEAAAQRELKDKEAASQRERKEQEAASQREHKEQEAAWKVKEAAWEAMEASSNTYPPLAPPLTTPLHGSSSSNPYLTRRPSAFFTARASTDDRIHRLMDQQRQANQRQANRETSAAAPVAGRTPRHLAEIKRGPVASSLEPEGSYGRHAN